MSERMKTTKKPAKLLDYANLLGQVKERIRHAQVWAVLSVNAELIRLYWDIGRMIAFFRAYPRPAELLPQPVAQLPAADSVLWSVPWGHHALLLKKVKDLDTRLWYMGQTLQHGWSRNILTIMIQSAAHARQGKAISNFADLLPPAQSDLIVQALKDPYVFDFLTLEEPFHERELETGLLQHIQRFLLELGQGFAFVGRQYPITVGDEDFYIDLLFYHLRLRCFVIIDLKKGAFKAEHAGKMNFYLNVVEDKLRHETDAPTIGLILCQDRNRVIAEYALRGMNKPIGISEYELTRTLPHELQSNLPTIEAIEAELAGTPSEKPAPKRLTAKKKGRARSVQGHREPLNVTNGSPTGIRRRTMKLLWTILILWLIPSLLQELRADVRTERLAEIPSAMEAAVAAGHAAGVVTLVMKDGKFVHHAATGFADREKQTPMSKDSVFWIASMTKSISATTILTLVDDGKLSLDEPASKWLPELAQMKLANGQPPNRPITLRDLLSHTSGLAFPPRKPTDGAHSLKGYTLELVKAPLAFEPGSNYEYGFGITVAGHIAEIVSGKPFDVLMRERVLDPLGMHDTSFHPDDRLRARIAKTYKTAEDGHGLVRTHNPFFTSDAGDRHMTEPSGGLFSTASDLARFYQMILDGGVCQGRRIVSESAIAEMARPHKAGGKTLSYGLGWQCSPPDKAAIPGFSIRAFGHGGAFATHGWIDPEQRVVTVFLVQNVLVNGSGSIRNAFHEKVAGEGTVNAR